MSLEAFRKPSTITFEVEDEKFVIDLPTRWNRPYTREWQMKLADMGEATPEGGIKLGRIDPAGLRDAQVGAFVSHCVVAGPITGDELLNDYRPLADALFDAAEVITNEEEARADALVGKLSGSSTGKPNGKAKSHSMKSSKKQGELPLPM